MIQPRPYQTEALKKILKRWREGVTRQLVSLPTGCGKTLIFGMVAGALKTRTLVLAHREELLLQARQKIRLVYSEADVGIFKAEERSGLWTDICVASVQTAIRNTDVLRERGFRLMICDEAHHAAAASYTKIFEALGFMGGDRNKLLLGVTATAYRGDNVGLGSVFEEIVFERSILAMMKAGYLCDVRGLEIKTGADISGVHTRTGDFALDELSVIIDTPERNALVADTYLEHGENRRGVVFGIGVEHALALAEAFRERGVPCAAVYGTMPQEERHAVLRRYEDGELRVLTNVGVLTEGWDVPDTSVVMMARPTKSKGLYIQCVGRGLRLAPGKEDCLLVDFADVAKKHRLCSFGTLAGDPILKRRRKQTLVEAVEEAEKLDILRRKNGLKKISHDAESFDLFERSKFVWQPLEQHYKLRLEDNSSLWCKHVSGGYSPLLFPQSGEIVALSEDILPLGYAMGVCEDYARQLSIAKTAMKSASWRKEEATEKQRKALKRMGVQFDPNISKGEASRLLDQKLGALATGSQVGFIRKRSLHPHPELLTKYEATKIIGRYMKAQEIPI
mgnify:FL=1